MSDFRRVTHEIVYARQPKPYADHETLHRVRFERNYRGEWGEYDISYLPKDVQDHIREWMMTTALIMTNADQLKDKLDMDRDWHESFISYAKLEGSVAEILTITPFTD